MAIPPVSRKGGKIGLPARVSGRQPCFGGSKGCAGVTGKTGENGQHSAAGRQLTLDKTVGSRVWSHTQGHRELRLDLGWGPG